MSDDISKAAHDKMDSRAALAAEFFEVTHAEVAPWVSDEANWYDFDYLDSEELNEAVYAHYGLTLDDDRLRMPFWSLLDFLDTNRK